MLDLRQLHFARLPVQENSLVVVVHRDRQLFLGAILANDVAVQKCFDLRRTGQAAVAGPACSRFSSSRMVWQTPTHSLQM